MAGTDHERLTDMLSAARKAVAFVEARSRAELDTDEMLALALARLLEIIGEAAKNVSQPTRDAHPEIPWRPMAGTRDRLTHGYSSVDLDIVWRIVRTDLPVLIANLETVLAGVEHRDRGRE